MYLVVNNTKNTRTKYEGSFPLNVLEEQLNNGDELIVISYYSNTIKVPYAVELNGIVEWHFKDFKG